MITITISLIELLYQIKSRQNWVCWFKPERNIGKIRMFIRVSALSRSFILVDFSFHCVSNFYGFHTLWWKQQGWRPELTFVISMNFKFCNIVMHDLAIYKFQFSLRSSRSWINIEVELYASTNSTEKHIYMYVYI